MNALRKLSQNLSTLNLLEILEEILDEKDELIVSCIQEQLTYGMRGNREMPRYSQKTKEIKARRGITLMTDRITLFDTGDFYKSMFSSIYGGSIEVDAKDWKRDMLVERYGEDIHKISSMQWQAIYEDIKPEFKKKVYEWLNQ